MATLMFQERFAELVRTGQKRQTIRPKRKRPIKPGDALSLRKWEGKAYRSKQVVLLADQRCKDSSDVTIYDGGGVTLRGMNLDERDKQRLARADGFEDFDEMYYWFNQTHTLPVDGDLIEW